MPATPSKDVAARGSVAAETPKSVGSLEGSNGDSSRNSPQAERAGWELPFEGLLRELQELQSLHEHWMLRLLDAHRQHLDTVLSSSGPPLPSDSVPAKPSVTGATNSQLTSSQRLRDQRPVHPSGRPAPVQGPVGHEPPRVLSPSSTRELSFLPGQPPRAATESPPLPREASFPQALSPEKLSRKSSDLNCTLDKPDIALRRDTRTQTWSQDRALEDSKLYKKKKTVEKVQQRLASARAKPFTRTFCTRASALVSHPRFEALLAIVIILNAVLIGAQANWNIQNVGCVLPLHVSVMDHTFSVLFTVELCLRVLAEGRYFMSRRSPNFCWNVLDSLLVLSGLAGDLLGMFVTWGTNITAIRLLRVLRLARAIRLIRVLRFFKDLRVMITGIFQSAKSLLWAFGLLLLIIYMYAICVLQVVGDHLNSMHSEGIYASPHCDMLKMYYGSLMLTVYTLFGCISGGHDWAGVAEPLLEIHPVMGVLNMLYVAFAVFCVLNVITGVFVENAFKINNDDEEKAILDMLESRRQWIREIKDLFKLADKGNTGYVGWPEFKSIISDVRVQASFRKLGLDVEVDSAHKVFELFDFGGSGLISLDEFAEGVQRVRGNARSIDICQLMYDNRVLKRQMGEVVRSLDGMLALLSPGVSVDDWECEA